VVTPADALGEPKRMNEYDSPTVQCNGSVCPECGKECKNQHGMRIHYAQSHDGNLYTTGECDWCGDEFRKDPGRDRVFCSYECRSKRRSEEGLPARERQVELVCEGCGERLSVPQSDAEGGKKYCSNECYYEDSNARWKNCEQCGDEYRAYGKAAEDRRFCSHDCYATWLAEEQPKEEHPRYKGDDRVSDAPSYGPGWNEEKRKAVRKRDDRACVVCGMAQSEHLERCGRKLNVHHIIPARESDSPEEHNEPTNLITLCAACHREWEGIPLRPMAVD